ncbi:MAG: hypothetical protein WCG25_09960 [bacterium]
MSSKSDITKKEKTVIVDTLKDQNDPFADIQDDLDIKQTTNTSTGEEISLSPELRAKIKDNFLDPLVYFHSIQSIFRKYNYVMTFEDIGRLKKILEEIEK